MINIAAPIVPVMLNTYFPPNQPTPARCYALVHAFAKATKAWPEDIRVAFVASGGLSHFTVDPDLDASVMIAFLARDGEVLGNIPKHRLNSGNSELDHGRRGMYRAGAGLARLHPLLPYPGGDGLWDGICHSWNWPVILYT